MAAPIVVTLPHQLGQDEAKRRITEAIDKGRRDMASVISDATIGWKANHADVRVTAIKQTVTAGLDVFDDSVRIELHLPWYFAPIQNKIVAALEKRGESSLKQIGPAKG
ncbi:MAG: polyhydroxyalkanoic acid system family protein [Hyphomicrobiales bacterium]|nr:polyhydroxyalkanoic acid system family protein [Hyphomicrobiales bacterium]